MYLHEYGHYIDSQKFGLTYFPVIGIPSFFSSMRSKHYIKRLNGVNVEGKGLTKHKISWTEIRANKNSADYFKKHYGVDWEGHIFQDYLIEKP